ncbi:MAG: SpaH/EbpB family LPXTG-anchored major pilin [Peptococcaceae bacterium]|nr:SpaH/EbpB family LPXTG-anchored major pilin [Peptococcaceae bacterium]
MKQTMRHKKFTAAALTLMMVFAFAAPTFAAGPGSITITNPSSSLSIDGHTFKAYRIFDLESYSGSNYAYKINEDFADFTYNTYTGAEIAGYLDTITDDPDALNAFAAAVWDYIDGAGAVVAVGTETASGNSSVTISGLDLGYYLVYSGDFSDGNSGSLVAAHILTTTDPDGVATLKADLPTIEKKVSDNATVGFADYTDLNIGDTAHFMLTSKVPNMNGYTSYVYTVHDTLSEGLTFNNDVEVTVGGASLTENTHYTIDDAPQGGYSAESFIIEFDPEEFIKLNSGADIVITYSATLNAGAAVAEPGDYEGDSNEVYLEYSNDPYGGGTGETPEDEVFVYTFKFDIFKYTLTDKEAADDLGNRTGLENAEFELRADAGDAGTAIEFVYENDIYRTAMASEGGTAITALTSDEDGNIEIRGLKAGTYYLVETEAPEGYNQLTAPIEVVIEEGTYDPVAGTLSYTLRVYNGSGYDTVTEVNVLNNTGFVFPESGGIGRTVFTVVGLLLMLGAGVTLVARMKTAGR